MGSLFLFIYTMFTKKDFVSEQGYAKSFSNGLLISAVGALCMIPSLHIGSYGMILGSFFVIALGFSLQQTAAQPFVVLLGEERTGAHRLNLAGGINSLGTTIGPLIVAYFLFGGFFESAGPDHVVSLRSVDTLYIGLVVLFVALGIFLRTIKIEQAKKSLQNEEFSFQALKYPQLVLGMVAIFVYVGVEVTIQSNMGALLKTPEYGSIPEANIFPFISLYWGSLMMGRWSGAAEVLSDNKLAQRVYLFLLPAAAFLVVYGVNYFKALSVPELNINTVFLPYFGFVMVMALVAYFTIENSAMMLLAFSLAGIACMIGGMVTTGTTSLLFFLSGGLWCSVMWPCIFAEGIRNLGKYTSQASAFLIMMILGGAVIPLIQGAIADAADIKTSYIITPLCFAYLAYYGWWSMKNNRGVAAQKAAH